MPVATVHAHSWEAHDARSIELRSHRRRQAKLAVIGLLGALVGTFIGRAVWGQESYAAAWTMSIIGAIVLVVGYHVLRRMRVGELPFVRSWDR